ncbi:MAG: VWA domain-containing protein [Hyphomicrobium sp.]|nr:VWA domain-containing protein [Hyphomicrobium sp.]
MVAFDKANSSLPAGSAPAESEATIKEAKENIPTLRQTETTRTKRSFRMHLSSRQSMGLAASLAALVIAAPLAFHQIETHAPGLLETVKGGYAPPMSEARRDQDFEVAQKDPAKAPAQPSLQSAEQSATPGRIEPQKQTAAPVAAAPSSAQSSGERSSSTALGTEFSGALFPKEGVTFDGGNLQIAGKNKEERKDAEEAIAAAPPPPPAPGLTDELAKPAAPAAAYRMRAAETKKLDGLAWMGGDRDERIAPQFEQENRDKFEAKEINPVKQVVSEPVSTFSIDVDTASYSFVRRALNAGHLPPKDGVRVEEMINYFPYAYPAPDTAETPFKPAVTVVPSPWNTNNKLVHVAIKGYDLKTAERPRANLVFLMDVSGSMQGEDRLPLVKNAFRLLLDQLQPDDTVGIVTYAGSSGIALEPTKASDKAKILSAIDALGAGGSTAGAAGIADAYRLAEANYDKSAVNRIILATDGDFNVGITDQDELKGFIERKRQSGIFLSILGVGQGNHNDALMQALAQNGNGTAAYVDTLNEARKVLVDEASSTLFTIAKDVKVQVEWNPQRVSEYRLVGYETRNLRREDFNNDRVDAGDIGSGHTVTAIYEITPVGAPKLVDDLRYAAKPAAQQPAAPETNAASNELGFLKLRYKRPREDVSQLISLPIADAGTGIENAPADVRFSTAVAAFGQIVKGEPYTQGYSFDDVLKLAQGARGDDPFGYRAEFLNLVRLAKSARP